MIIYLGGTYSVPKVVGRHTGLFHVERLSRKEKDVSVLSSLSESWMDGSYLLLELLKLTFVHSLLLEHTDRSLLDRSLTTG